MDNKLKKFIAREGIIILGIFMLGVAFELINIFILNLRPNTHLKYLYDITQMIVKGFIFLAIGYPLYLVSRFIIWAIRTLKK